MLHARLGEIKFTETLEVPVKLTQARKVYEVLKLKTSIHRPMNML